ncbi:MAG: hypothetical protein Q7T03_00050 [Deltaproteobacteria bacterium]|nr:hypothetical protein [Deltaproteobacteria bacterium]
MLATIVPIQSLVGTSGIAEVYGEKVEGYVRLLGAQVDCEFKFEVPQAFAVPMRSAVAGLHEKELRSAFDALTRRFDGPKVLMARSSGKHEAPGQNESLFVPYRPHRFLSIGQGAKNFRKFAEAVEKMRQDPDMGILLSANVARDVRKMEGRSLLGGELVSFVASTHCFTNPSDIFIAIVQGLGTRAVDAGSDAVILQVDRETSEVRYFGHKTISATQRDEGTIRPATLKTYCQREVDVYDLGNGRVSTVPLTADFVREANLFMQLIGNVLINGDYPVGIPLLTPGTYSSGLGLAPFDDADMLHHLVGILRYFSERFGPSQIEGAFSNRREYVPHLYQHIPLPEISREVRPLRNLRTDIVSPHVMGVGTFEGPLVYTEEFYGEGLEEIDRRFAETGYILVAVKHTKENIAATPHCRCRLSMERANVSSHAVTYMGSQIHRDPKGEFVFASGIQINNKTWIGDIIFNRALLDSNGSELVVEIIG